MRDEARDKGRVEEGEEEERRPGASVKSRVEGVGADEGEAEAREEEYGRRLGKVIGRDERWLVEGDEERERLMQQGRRKEGGGNQR
jgi:hypothetical protein